MYNIWLYFYDNDIQYKNENVTIYDVHMLADREKNVNALLPSNVIVLSGCVSVFPIFSDYSHYHRLANILLFEYNDTFRK